MAVETKVSSFAGVELHRGTLSNGMRMVVAVDPSAHTLSVQWAVRVGSRDEPPRLNGISHLVEHLKFRGTERFPFEGDLLKHLRSFGAVYNASTDRELTCFWVECRPLHLEHAIDLMGEMASTHRFNGLETERKVVLDELGIFQMEQGVLWNLDEIMMLSLWPEHAFGLSIHGSPSTVQVPTLEDLETWLTLHYTADNSVLVVVGAVDPAAAFASAEKHFARLRRGPVITRRPLPDVAPGALLKLEGQTDRTSARLAFALNSGAQQDTLAVGLLSVLLRDRFFDSVRSRKGLAYSCGADARGYSDVTVFSGHVDLTAGKLPETIGDWVGHLTELRAKGPNRVELDAAREVVSTEFAKQWNEPGTLGYELAVEALDPTSAPGELVPMLMETLTAADLQATAQKLFVSKGAHLLARGTPAPAEYQGAWARLVKGLSPRA